jgi:hypothetical protein
MRVCTYDLSWTLWPLPTGLRVPLFCFHPMLQGRPREFVRPEGLDLRISTMPSIHFAQVRATISLAQVLNLIGFVPCEDFGDQVRGPCPLHRSASPSSRSFSANLKRHIYRCFRYGSSGNQLDLYASVTGLSLYEAAVALCEQLDQEIPWMHGGSPSSTRDGRTGK